MGEIGYVLLCSDIPRHSNQQQKNGGRLAQVYALHDLIQAFVVQRLCNVAFTSFLV